MTDTEKVVCRFNDGRVTKGYLTTFSPGADSLVLRQSADGPDETVPLEELKALFFVRTFEGDHEHREKKTYGATKPKGSRVFIRFRDGEALVGFLEGGVPWKRGFFLDRQADSARGFFLHPVDGESNNVKVFVVAASVADVTVVP